MILVIDHHDSFVHNLARYVELCDEETVIMRADEIEKLRDKPKAIILSPGPCAPKDTPQTMRLIKKAYKTVPILGICLGHQCIAEAFDGTTKQAETPVHGRASAVFHDKHALFNDIPSPFMAGRYHSLISQIQETELSQIAKTQDNILMGFQHKLYPTYGLQFHPESILTEHGQTLIENFLKIVDTWHKKTGHKKSG